MPSGARSKSKAIPWHFALWALGKAAPGCLLVTRRIGANALKPRSKRAENAHDPCRPGMGRGVAFPKGTFES